MHAPVLTAPVDHAPVLAPRMRRIQASPAAVLRRRARELRAAGRDVIELSSGDLDFPTPDHVIAAAAAAARAGQTRYTNVDGTPELKDAVRAAFRRQNGLDFARDEIIVCAGSTQALFNALLATLAPGDEVVVPTPCWAPYVDQARLADGVPVLVPCRRNNGFKLRPEDLAAALTGRTRWVVLNNPVNPTGAVYSAAELAALGEIILRHPNVWVLADGLYEHIVFDGHRAPTIAEVDPRLKARTLTVGGVAKSYAMTGWRIGYAGGSAALVAAMTKIQSQTTSCPSSVSQAAALAALTGPQELLAERAAVLAERRDAFVNILNGCDDLTCTVPQGTFYLLVSCAGVIGKHAPDGREITSDRDFAAYLLDTADVAVLPGEDCGLSPYIRVSFANSMAVIEEAGRRIGRACGELR
jgi:aspartate aminotransferase